VAVLVGPTLAPMVVVLVVVGLTITPIVALSVGSMVVPNDVVMLRPIASPLVTALLDPHVAPSVVVLVVFYSASNCGHACGGNDLESYLE